MPQDRSGRSMAQAPYITCNCGAPATAGSIRGECASCFRARLQSIRLDTSVTSTRSRKNYYDRTSLDETYGDDRVDRYWDETDGQGALVKGPDGEFYHKPHG